MNLRVKTQQELLRLASFKPPLRVQRLAKKAVVIPSILLAIGVIFVAYYASTHTMAVISTQGPIGDQERNLFLFALGLSLIVVLPVFGLLALFALRYRESNDKATYQPELAGSKTAETIWWVVPSLLIVVLSVVTWNSAHSLDPYKPLASTITPLRVQVISLDWKWLFIYPDYKLATINELHVPTGTPINLTLTSDAPMNSLWIPQLGGQIYTMPGMMTRLHLQADHAGSYRGQSANISGVGFAGMHFQTVAQSSSDFSSWMQRAKLGNTNLTSTMYNDLAKPSKDMPATTYASVDPGIFNNAIMKYMPDGMAGMSMESDL